MLHPCMQADNPPGCGLHCSSPCWCHKQLAPSDGNSAPQLAVLLLCAWPDSCSRGGGQGSPLLCLQGAAHTPDRQTPGRQPGESCQATLFQPEAHLQGRLHCLGHCVCSNAAGVHPRCSQNALPIRFTQHPCPCCLQLVLLVGSSGEAARFALEHGPGEVPSAATVVSALQDLADNGDPDSMYEAAACLDALQARHADVTGDEGTDLA